MLFSSKHSRPRYSNLQGSSDALALAQYAVQHSPLVIIAANALEAQRLVEEIPFFDPKLRVHLLPDWETLPYDHFSPHQDLISERLATLHHIRSIGQQTARPSPQSSPASGRGSERENQSSTSACDVIVVPITTALYPLPPVSYLAAYTFFLKKGERLDLDAFRQQMTLAGYNHVQQVLTPGEYCVRGGIIDLFAMGSVLPYRIDLFDDEIETIATFDVDTQRTLYPVPEIRLLPAREFPLDEKGQATFRQNFRDRFEGDPSKSRIYKDVSKGIAPAGIEYYLPLFFDQTATLFDYLPKIATLCLHHNVDEAITSFGKDAASRYNLLRGDPQHPLLETKELFLDGEQFFIRAKEFARIDVIAASAPSPLAPLPEGEGNLSSLSPGEGVGVREDSKNTTRCSTAAIPPIAVDRRAEVPTQKFADFLRAYAGRVLLLAESLGRREIMSGYLKEYGLTPAVCEDYASFLAGQDKFMLGVGPVQIGFSLPDEQLAIVTETELYAAQPRSRANRAARKSNVEGMLRDLSELKPGDPVVHEQHGIARYRGLVNLDLGEGENEFLLLEYAGEDKLYVPVSQLHVISRYSGGAAEAAPLHKLGSGAWDKAKRRAMQQVRDTAAELLNIYAQRATRKGHAFKLTYHDYEAFAAGFGFEETADQAAAIEAVLLDLQSGKPMDRLICGDVGFGKTEVALRAAFVAASEGKQVAVLVPTTLLAEQHFQNFSTRFADWPIRIAELSRFRSAKEVTQALKDLADGKLDIVIGTHKLIQKDVKFHNLGLVILDEEHRFGVQQKEKLKALRAEVDVLTLTATPIPRTLAMSLEGLRDFSVIATAPQRRLSIKTFVSGFSQGVIREAVLRELKRGGQVYFLHNEVDTIANMLEKLETLLPEARIRVAHGQMGERDLEAVMRDFHHQRFNVLLCSTIIETGIDVPTANTIIMNRADRFGLAQLHQLRGRVGRSHHQAYAYLLVDSMDGLTAQAKKRLEAIQAMEQLGSGFFLAMHDLEIRGAGEVLGESQSGEMQEIGFSLYNDMLAAAIASLKQGKEPDMTHPLGVTTEINLHTPALLPNDYCGDIHQRLIIYKRLANCDTQEDLDDMQQELIDRFGLLPEPAQTLLDSHRLRILAKPLGISKVDASSEAIVIQFVPNPPIDPMKVITMIQSKRHIKMAGQDKLRIELKYGDLQQRVLAVRNFFGELK
ncbi:transcription-repair coupling factor [Sideroxydans lithotrophicus]|uniref:Transcription-repair-coupling factor n=1 Tax=Sideroxydans lithotrophicus (strain ES-1) TaxID=580332 RepID=D5CUS4_SIDLE|nr:transcription-repair coupling factor [Sideroxydans lithotrophicus]ADE12461.1 transcription-repair coupling factor [Sideroxydans lithotrophicus ES-1]